MASKRKYPEKKCKNPACVPGKFTPHDRRQLFCTIQCRTNFHNDKRHHENNSTFKNERRLREMDKKLKKISTTLEKKGIKQVSQQLFEYEEVDLSLSVETNQNKKSHRQIRWFYRYGIELVDSEKNAFEIHFRNKD